jgi:hypothetical protein
VSELDRELHSLDVEMRSTCILGSMRDELESMAKSVEAVDSREAAMM